MLSHRYLAAAAAKSHQLCPTLCDPIDRSPPGSSVPGILQARTLGWVAISFSNAWKWKVKVKSLSRVRLLATPWTAAYQAPPSMGFPRQECFVGCYCLLCTGILQNHNLFLFFLFYVQFQCFPLICFLAHWSSVLSNIVLIPSNLFLISVILHFYLVLFYIFCLLKNFSFSLCSSNLFPSSLNIFVIITFMNSLLDRLHISTSLSSFSVVLSFFFVLKKCFCCLILPNFLFLFLCTWWVVYICRFCSGLL